MTNATLALIYLAPVSLCNNYSFIYDLLFIHPEATTSLVEKRLLEFLVYSSISIMKKLLQWKLCETPPKNIYSGVLDSSTSADLLGMPKTYLLDRFMFVLYVQKKACLKNYSHVQRCAHPITCFICRSLNYLYSTSFWIRDICCSMKNKGSIRSAM